VATIRELQLIINACATVSSGTLGCSNFKS
jgi:hypothetical protein